MKRLTDLLKDEGLGSMAELRLPEEFHEALASGKIKINIFALGDVGTNILMGLKTLGGDVISEIGIYDINESQVERLVLEMGQIYGETPVTEGGSMPRVRGISRDELPDCHALIFCASRGIPEPGPGVDVRMAQLDANREIIGDISRELREGGFRGMIFQVSDPVDPLSMEFLNTGGFHPSQIRGCGLGVMYARGRFYAERDERFKAFLTEGRAFGPHGRGLVLADSLENYDDELSRELTELAISANLKVRELGYKPFMAPAYSSAVFSILAFLKGQWSYGSIYMGDGERGAFLGVRSRVERSEDGTYSSIVFEDKELPDLLYKRILESYRELLMLAEK